MRITPLLPLVLLATLASCGKPPSADCITLSLSAEGEAGIYGDAQAERITRLQCERIQMIAERSGCGIGVYAFMRDHPEEAMAAFVPPSQITPKDVAGFARTAAAVAQACGF